MALVGQASEPVPQPGLQRRIGLVAATASGVGIILGAGIYVLVGEAAAIAGNGVWAAFVIGAVLAAGTGLSYAELTAMYPEAGAAAAYAKEAFGARAAFVTGWMDAAVNAIGAPAVALGFAAYVAHWTNLNSTAVAVAVLLASAAIVLAGVRETTALAGAFAVVEVCGLLVVLAVGLPRAGSVDLLTVTGGIPALLGAAALVFFAYEGFEEIATLSEEVKDPTRNVPRALLVAIVLTTVLYVAVAVAAVGTLSPEELAAAEAPLAAVVESALGDRFAEAFSAIALFATFNTVLLLVATGSRALYGMSRRGLLPRIVGTVSPRRRTPWVATLGMTAVAIGFVLTGEIAFVAQVTNFAVFALFCSVNGAVIRLRHSQPGISRPFRVRPSIGGWPLPTLIGITGAVGLSIFMDRTALVAGVVTLTLGFIASYLFIRPTRHSVPNR